MMFSDIPVRNFWACEVFTCGSGNSSSGRRLVVATFWGHYVCVSSHFRDICQDEDGNSDDDDADVHLVHLRSQEEIRRTLAWSHELDLHLELWQIRMMMMMMRIVSPGTIRMVTMILMRTLRKTRISFLSFWKASPCQMLMILVGTALILGRNGLTEDISRFWSKTRQNWGWMGLR